MTAQAPPPEQDLTANYFALFGLPEDYEVDNARLARVYRDLQRSVHPDRFAGAPEQERRLSVQRAARVNDAYRTLKDPLSRARYLLGLRGVDTGEEANTVMDPAFLMEQMEWRERLEEAMAGDDAMGDLMRLSDELQASRRAMQDSLAEMFRAGTEEALQQAAETVRKLRFLDRLTQEVTAREEQF